MVYKFVFCANFYGKFAFLIIISLLDSFHLVKRVFFAGTTYSCIGAYEAVTGSVHVIADTDGRFCIPSVVAFR